MFDNSTSCVGIDLGDRKSFACVYSGGAAEYFEFAMTKANEAGVERWRHAD